MRPRRERLPRGGHREEGFILFLAILVLLIVTAAGLATMLTTSMDLTLSGNETKVSKVFYAADSGVGYSAARLRSDVNFIGGADAGRRFEQLRRVGLRRHPGHDHAAAHNRPAGSAGDALLAQGTTYGTPQVVESLFTISSTASATSIQASKTIRADIAIYPQILSNVPR